MRKYHLAHCSKFLDHFFNTWRIIHNSALNIPQEMILPIFLALIIYGLWELITYKCETLKEDSFWNTIKKLLIIMIPMPLVLGRVDISHR